MLFSLSLSLSLSLCVRVSVFVSPDCMPAPRRISLSTFVLDTSLSLFPSPSHCVSVCVYPCAGVCVWTESYRAYLFFVLCQRKCLSECKDTTLLVVVVVPRSSGSSGRANSGVSSMFDDPEELKAEAAKEEAERLAAKKKVPHLSVAYHYCRFRGQRCHDVADMENGFVQFPPPPTGGRRTASHSFFVVFFCTSCNPSPVGSGFSSQRAGLILRGAQAKAKGAGGAAKAVRKCSQLDPKPWCVLFLRNAALFMENSGVSVLACAASCTGEVFRL